MTPPAARNGAGRVTKRSALKKDTKKTAEARLPGFSIMTKDGIDVTSTAGRGTKTKEQREHAHLMRQLKACAECKRKKVRVSREFFYYHKSFTNGCCSVIPPIVDPPLRCHEPLLPPPRVERIPVLPHLPCPRNSRHNNLHRTWPSILPMHSTTSSCFRMTTLHGTLLICNLPRTRTKILISSTSISMTWISTRSCR